MYLYRDDLTYTEYKTLQLYNFVKIIKTPKNFAEGSFSMRLAEIWKKQNRSESVDSGPL